MVIYSEDAKKAVAGLHKLCDKFPMYNPVMDLIVSQWILETDHFRSKLFAGFRNSKGLLVPYNCGGKKGGSSRESELKELGITIPIRSIKYTDWNGKEDDYLKLQEPGHCATLYHFFLKRKPYTKAMQYLADNHNKNNFSPEQWLTLIADPYVAEISGVNREDFETKSAYEKAVDVEYVKRVFALSVREATRKLIVECVNHTEIKEPEDDYPEWLLGPRS